MEVPLLPRQQTPDMTKNPKPSTRSVMVIYCISRNPNTVESFEGRISEEVSDSSNEFWWWIFIRNETSQIFTYLIQKCFFYEYYTVSTCFLKAPDICLARTNYL
jgi:hypothetical protein